MALTRTPASLLHRLRTAPDKEAWERFVEIYGPLLHRWLCNYGVQHHDACDIGQDILITVVGEMPNFHYDRQRGSFRGWLRTIMINRLRAFWRARQTQSADWAAGNLEHQLAELADPGSDLVRRWDDEHDSHVLAQVLALLKGEFETVTWQAFWRTVVKGEKPAVVAATLGITRNAVYLSRSRVLRRLRQEAEGLLD
jgi:RNA polymerase sigma-70 factor (ECF subfamily)